MINENRSKQSWQPGQTIKVGFMTLRVDACVPTPGDYRPDEYMLSDPRNGRRYVFTPHLGLSRYYASDYRTDGSL